MSASQTEPPTVVDSSRVDGWFRTITKSTHARSQIHAPRRALRGVRAYERIANRTTERALVDGSQVDGSVQKQNVLIPQQYHHHATIRFLIAREQKIPPVAISPFFLLFSWEEKLVAPLIAHLM